MAWRYGSRARRAGTTWYGSPTPCASAGYLSSAGSASADPHANSFSVDAAVTWDTAIGSISLLLGRQEQPGERLVHAAWRHVLNPARVHDAQLGELRRQCARVVPGDRQPGAVGGAVGREGPDDDVPARVEGLAQRRAVAVAIGGLGEEVEDRSVMPQVVPATRNPRAHVLADPLHATGSTPEPLLSGPQRM